MMWVLQPTTQPGGYQMTQKMSPLRRRMIEDMTVRNLSPATQRSYISAVLKFSRYFGRSPDQLELEDVRAFQVHLVSTGISWPGLNQIVCALRFFYGVTLGQALIPERASTAPSRDHFDLLSYRGSASGSNLTLESRMGFPSDLPNVVVGFQAAISRFVAEANDDPKPFTWLADPNKSIVAVRRGYQVLDSIH
jgi:hypothetical protein